MPRCRCCCADGVACACGFFNVGFLLLLPGIPFCVLESVFSSGLRSALLRLRKLNRLLLLHLRDLLSERLHSLKELLDLCRLGGQLKLEGRIGASTAWTSILRNWKSGWRADDEAIERSGSWRRCCCAAGAISNLCLSIRDKRRHGLRF